MRGFEAIPSPQGRGNPPDRDNRNFIPKGISEPFRGFYQQKETTMKTGRDAKRSGLYVSECCQKQRDISEGQMLPRCPICLSLTDWEIQKQGTGDRDEKDHTYPCIV
jgi:hypothetical protein